MVLSIPIHDKAVQGRLIDFVDFDDGQTSLQCLLDIVSFILYIYRVTAKGNSLLK